MKRIGIMNDFTIFFELGWKHIISTDALDHQLFILALTAIYLKDNWKQVLILVTAFTIGHSLTLALSAYDIIRFSSTWVEFLIPLSIVITAALNFFQKDFEKSSLRKNYVLALLFGLIHGLGFANTIRFMLANDQLVSLPLLSFNLGLEAGQIVLVSIILLLSYLIVNKAGLQRKWWMWMWSSIALIISCIFCIQRWPL
ncbi:MAG: HupE/UreJ family protein [Ferruginibacter sp.]